MVPKILAKGKPNFINGPVNLPNKAPRNPPGCMILDHCGLLSFISINILLAKAFILVFCLVIRNNSLTAADFNLFSYVFVSLNLAPS